MRTTSDLYKKKYRKNIKNLVLKKNTNNMANIHTI